ncbi:MAG: sigma 54-interacting transcriptional regulator [Planctomycetota bacterium]
MAGKSYLILKSGTQWSELYPLCPPNEMLIGRSSHCQIVLKSERCSRRHARVFWDSGDTDGEGSGWWVQDLGSRNGTKVDRTPLTAPHRLLAGDEFELAGFEFRFVEDLRSGGAIASDDETPASTSAASLRITNSIELSPSGTARSKIEDDHTAGEALALAFELSKHEKDDAILEEFLNHIPDYMNAASATIFLHDGESFHEAASKSYQDDHAIANQEVDFPLLQSLGRTVVRLYGDSESKEPIVAAPLIVAGQSNPKGYLRIIGGQRDALMGRSLPWMVQASRVLSIALERVDSTNRLRGKLETSDRELAELRRRVNDNSEIVGKSQAIKLLRQQIEKVAPLDCTVLVRGPSGAGKELVSAAIHRSSPRRRGPMVCLNCAALTTTLLESELFGYEKGAFTDATSQKIGKFEAADGGTLMLDEIGEMELPLQAKVLRVLEGQPFERVGGNEPIHVDVRLIAATHRDLEKMVAEGTFRQDLFYRIDVVPILVPPLKERVTDVPLLIAHFIGQLRHRIGAKELTIAPETIDFLKSYDWPGNIRQLKNAVERAAIFADGDELQLNDFALPRSSLETISSNETTLAAPSKTLAEVEDEYIDLVLRFTDGNKSAAAKILGIERSTLDRRLKRRP